MAELKFEAPLAQFEESDEWGPVDYQSSVPTSQTNQIDSLNYLNNLKENLLVIDNNNTIDNLKMNATNSLNNNNNISSKILTKDNIDNFNEDLNFSGSLEDLVNTFDEKITKCFGNYEQSVEELAPVQVRSQEEIMNECQWVEFSFLHAIFCVSSVRSSSHESLINLYVVHPRTRFYSWNQNKKRKKREKEENLDCARSCWVSLAIVTSFRFQSTKKKRKKFSFYNV